MSIEAVLLLATGAIILFLFAKREEVNEYRHKWDAWDIRLYRITVRYNQWSMYFATQFETDILGDGTTITVQDGQIVDVYGPKVKQVEIEEYYAFTVDGLFEQMSYGLQAQYDSVYGFPMRLSIRNNVIFEVTSFEVLEYHD